MLAWVIAQAGQKRTKEIKESMRADAARARFLVLDFDAVAPGVAWPGDGNGGGAERIRPCGQAAAARRRGEAGNPGKCPGARKWI
ncbi:MAG: hypothetical protein AB7V22_08035 [Kiritimatiellia bacterium]